MRRPTRSPKPKRTQAPATKPKPAKKPLTSETRETTEPRKLRKPKSANQLIPKRQPEYWIRAIRHLSNDPILKTIIQAYQGESIRSRGTPFETLLRSIVGQQISVKAADSVWRKFQEVCPVLDPRAILSTQKPILRSAGLSERKVEYCRDLALHFHEERISVKKWNQMSDEEVIQDLIQVKGIGRWTAEMFLIFHLLRPDVLPVDDLGLQKAISIKYRKRYPMTSKTMLKLARPWEPYRSVATWYLWRSLDPIPVEY